MKILCLGNNTEDTDVKTRKLASNELANCYGLLSELDGAIVIPTLSGWYHSSVYDVEYGRLKELAANFDLVVMLDQPKEQYSHPDAFYKTVDLIKNLPNGQFIDPTYADGIGFFEKLVTTNKSFCIFPFIELLTNMRSDGYTTVCCRSKTPVTKLSEVDDFYNNKDYRTIRNKMLSGELVPEHCDHCYQIESKGMRSARQQETVEWANRLGVNSLNELDSIKHPAYYEVRPSNVCNLQCRMCTPESSNSIAKEYEKLKLISRIEPDEKTNFDIINFIGLKKLYVAGGEPTAMPEFYDFLDRCINENKIFEFLVNTNATKLNNKFKKQLKQLPHIQFIISVEGVGDLNHYIRWPSIWDTIVENMKYLVANNHKISTNTTVSIYNITKLYKLFKWLDDEFPGVLVHAQLASSENDMLSALRFPDVDLALASLLPIQKLQCYKNDKLLQSFIDGLIRHYQSNPKIDLEKLKLFFEFNDKLDQSRNIKLADYIPELEQKRKLIL
jgi:uncharacterized Fe-S cluster-containing radical SAM superfamily protein